MVLAVGAIFVAAAAPLPRAAESRMVLTAPNGQTTAIFELRDDGTLEVRIAGTLTRAGLRRGQQAPVEIPLRGEFAFVPSRRNPRDPFGSPPGAEVQVLQDGRVVAYLGGPVARPLVP
jgi:hypothetical protein